MARKKLTIISVGHREDHPSFKLLLKWIDENVKPGMKIGLEGDIEHDTFDEILETPEGGVIAIPKTNDLITKVKEEDFLFSHPETRSFFKKVKEKIKEKGGKIEQIDNYTIRKTISDLNRKIRKIEKENTKNARELMQLNTKENVEFNDKNYTKKGEKGLFLPTNYKQTNHETKIRDLTKKIMKQKEEINALETENSNHEAMRSAEMLKNSLKKKLPFTIMGCIHGHDIEILANHVQQKEVKHISISNEEKTIILEHIIKRHANPIKLTRQVEHAFREIRA
ncbi:MAG: hypothetical protein ABH803_04400 [Candidatus Micrarchaeota archaeon]